MVNTECNMTTTISIKTKNISKHFSGIYAVDGVDAQFEKGKITALIGPNGSGKSTLINLITGIIPYDKGTVSFGNKKLGKIEPYEILSKKTTRTFQNIRLIEQMSIEDNLLITLTNRKVIGGIFEFHSKKHTDEVTTVLDRIGLKEKRHVTAEKLSYGQRKLLEVGRALLTKSNIYFFDEPFAGLFPEMIKIVSRILEELKDSGTTVVLVEHNMQIIKELSDYCIVMDEGKVLAEGITEEVLNREDVIEAYLGK